MAAMNNGEYKQGWITGYYPYGEYMIMGNKMIFSGDEQKVNNSILTRKVVEQSNSGFNGQTGGGLIKKFRLNGRRVKEAFKELEERVDGWIRDGKYRGDGFLVLSVEGLEDGLDRKFVKIYGKKNM